MSIIKEIAFIPLKLKKLILRFFVSFIPIAAAEDSHKISFLKETNNIMFFFFGNELLIIQVYYYI